MTGNCIGKRDCGIVNISDIFNYGSGAKLS